MFKKEKLVKKDNYVVHFEAALSNKDVALGFHEFLKSECNEEPWLFLNEVNELKELKENQIHTKIKRIIEKYMEKDSELQINISFETLKKTLSLVEDSQEKKIPKEELIQFFDEISESIRLQLRHDSWKRFYRSKFCENLIQKYYLDSTICSPTTTIQSFYKEDHFEHPFVDDSEFEFGDNLMEDSYDWEVRKKKNFLIYSFES